MVDYKPPYMGQYQAPHQLMRLAQVTAVNTVAGTVEVVYADGMGRRNDIQVGWPFFSTNSLYFFEHSGTNHKSIHSVDCCFSCSS